MSLSAVEDIKCLCGEIFPAEIYQSVTIEEDPELKDLILGGEFNMVQCPACSEVVYAERFVLYHDRSEELMAFVYPYALQAQAGAIRSEMLKTFKDLQDALAEDQKLPYGPVLLFGMDQLTVLLTEDDEITDEMDVVSYLCKSLGLKFKKIQKSLARQNRIPSLLPLQNSPSGGLRENLIQGLQKILDTNDRLVHYQKFFTLIKSDPAWKI